MTDKLKVRIVGSLLGCIATEAWPGLVEIGRRTVIQGFNSKGRIMRYELTFRYRGRLIRGTYVLHDGMVTVTSEDGRSKSTQIGGSAGVEETLARIMLRKLDDAAPR